MDIQNEDENRGYEAFTDLCVYFYYMLDHIHDYSEYRVDGLKCALKFGAMFKLNNQLENAVKEYS